MSEPEDAPATPTDGRSAPIHDPSLDEALDQHARTMTTLNRQIARYRLWRIVRHAAVWWFVVVVLGLIVWGIAYAIHEDNGAAWTCTTHQAWNGQAWDTTDSCRWVYP